MAVVEYSVRMRFTGPTWGWSEQYYYRGVDIGLSDVIAGTTIAVLGRRTALAHNIQLASVSIGKLPLDAASTVYYREVNCGPGLDGTGVCTRPWSAILVDVLVDSFTWRRQILLRGWIDANTTWSGFDPGNISRPTAMWSKFKIMRQGFQAVQLGTTPLASNWGILARSTGADFVKLTRWPILAVGEWDSCGTLAIAVPTAAGFALHDKIHLTGFTDCSLKGMSGDRQIVALGTSPPLPAAPAGAEWFVTNKRTCCEGSFTYNGRASVYKIARQVVPWSFWDLAGVRNRQTGKPAHVTRGRARKRRCCS